MLGASARRHLIAAVIDADGDPGRPRTRPTAPVVVRSPGPGSRLVETPAGATGRSPGGPALEEQ